MRGWVDHRICLRLCEEEKNLSVAGTRTWAVKFFAISTDLSQLLYIAWVDHRIGLRLCGEEKNLSVAGTRTWAVKFVAISTELSRLLYIGFMKSILIGNLTVVAIHITCCY
jgi:hypothetical protein